MDDGTIDTRAELSISLALDSVEDLTRRLNASLDSIPRYTVDDLTVHGVLGRGGSCSVYKVSVLQDPSHCALKRLQPRLYHDSLRFATVGRQLSREAVLLSAMDHPHIVQLRGVTAGSLRDNLATTAQPSGGYFLLLEPLEPLPKRLWKWKSMNERECTSGLFYQQSQWKALVRQRLPIALQIAKTLAYLHDRGIVYRDLKPDNIGFSDDDTVKLFDFGLAKLVSEKMEPAGSPRYMAPEVAKALGGLDAMDSGTSMDIYSFAMLLWQLCTLETPFACYSTTEHYHRVMVVGERPKMFSWWPRALQDLLRDCWHADPNQRPCAKEVVRTLEEELLPIRVLRKAKRQEPNEAM